MSSVFRSLGCCARCEKIRKGTALGAIPRAVHTFRGRVGADYGLPIQLVQGSIPCSSTKRWTRRPRSSCTPFPVLLSIGQRVVGRAGWPARYGGLASYAYNSLTKSGDDHEKSIPPKVWQVDTCHTQPLIHRPYERPVLGAEKSTFLGSSSFLAVPVAS